jgi:sigma-B regulation protein RsbU (phosphoserine phosphatase)
MTPAEAVLRDELEDRRTRLEAALAESNRSDLADLLHQLDDALSRLGTDAWGVCESCHGEIEEERLAADPLVRVCLQCLNPTQRRDLERDLRTAAQVQSALLPPATLSRCGWEAAYLWEPLGPVSGDHIDMPPTDDPDGPIHLFLGDVAGKGIAASLLQSQLHALFRAAEVPGLDLRDLVTRVNRLFCNAIGPQAYATMVATRLYSDGKVQWINAGHPPPFLIDMDGARELGGHDLPLGMFCDTPFVQREVELKPGDTLVLYTDGWTEAPCGLEEYGRQRAAQVLAEHAGDSLDELLQAGKRDMLAFIGDGQRIDDFSLVALRRTQ